MIQRRMVFVLCGILLLSGTSLSQLRTWKFGVGLSGSVNQMQSDHKTNDLGAGAQAGFTLSFAEHWGVRGAVGINMFKAKNPIGEEFQSNPFYGKLYVSYDILPEGKLNPFLFAGGGMYYISATKEYAQSLIGRDDKSWDVGVAGGAGVDIFLDPLWSITISGEGTYMAMDNLEGIRAGSGKDIALQVNIGFRYYFYDALFFLGEKQQTSSE